MTVTTIKIKNNMITTIIILVGIYLLSAYKCLIDSEYYYYKHGGKIVFMDVVFAFYPVLNTIIALALWIFPEMID